MKLRTKTCCVSRDFWFVLVTQPVHVKAFFNGRILNSLYSMDCYLILIFGVINNHWHHRTWNTVLCSRILHPSPSTNYSIDFWDAKCFSCLDWHQVWVSLSMVLAAICTVKWNSCQIMATLFHFSCLLTFSRRCSLMWGQSTLLPGKRQSPMYRYGGSGFFMQWFALERFLMGDSNSVPCVSVHLPFLTSPQWGTADWN